MSTVHVAIPVYHRPELVIPALEALGKSDFGSHGVSVCLSINGASDELARTVLEWVAGSSSKAFAVALVAGMKTNVGKALSVNTCLVRLTAQCGAPDFIVSLDSDLIALDLDWLPRMLDAFGAWSTEDHRKPLGALSAGQDGNSGHFLGVASLAAYRTNLAGSSFTTHPHNHCIAGGCLLVPNAVWTSVAGYRARKIHGDDDGPFMSDLARRGLTAAVLEDVRFFHPFDEDAGYLDWKLRALRGQLRPGEEGGYAFTEKAETAS